MYAEAGSADDPRGIMAGAGFAMDVSTFSGMELVLSGMLMHRREGGNEEGSEGDDVGGGIAAGGMSNGKANAVEAVGGAEPVVSAVLPQLHAGTHARHLPCPWDVFSTHLGESTVPTRHSGERQP